MAAGSIATEARLELHGSEASLRHVADYDVVHGRELDPVAHQPAMEIILAPLNEVRKLRQNTPSRRGAMPASTIVQMAARTARSNSSFIKSTRICGGVMSNRLLMNALGSVRDPEFNQARETGDHKQFAGC